MKHCINAIARTFALIGLGLIPVFALGEQEVVLPCTPLGTVRANIIKDTLNGLLNMKGWYQLECHDPGNFYCCFKIKINVKTPGVNWTNTQNLTLACGTFQEDETVIYDQDAAADPGRYSLILTLFSVNCLDPDPDNDNFMESAFSTAEVPEPEEY